ncbi:MAG: class I SAM-dependent methyltransferase, partial [Solirubrobacterales bacterium]|nr:class I SAM-dependent methyltransferase [Solirubrobacterales bacterium]
DSLSRRCAFLEQAVTVAGATNARVVNARAETWPEGLAAFDVITARALAPLPVVAEYAAPLLIVGGTLVVWRGRRNPRDEEAGARAAAQLGLKPIEIRHMQPFSGAEHRYLHLMSKVTETPSGFPRRPGVATKRPLGMQ